MADGNPPWLGNDETVELPGTAGAYTNLPDLDPTHDFGPGGPGDETLSPRGPRLPLPYSIAPALPDDASLPPYHSAVSGWPPSSSDTLYPYAPDAPTTAQPVIVPEFASGASHQKSPRRPRRAWLIALSVGLVVLLALAGAGGFVYARVYQAPGAAATGFCHALAKQQYGQAYGLLSADMRSATTLTQFTQAATDLDALEGTVRTCTAATGGNGYSYALGSNSASVSSTITRQKTGILTGTLDLAYEQGSWRIASLPVSLLGVNLGALLAAHQLCAALLADDTTAAYQTLGASVAGSEQQFATENTLWDQISGKVRRCAIVGVSAGNTDTAARLSLALQRARSPPRRQRCCLVQRAQAGRCSRCRKDSWALTWGPSM